ncbi:MAG: ribbon-helix-helix protein, CopG family [Proteobacteria bacterium]|nr:ribbon-helix-helix protein, CopG family [Pseudomonadota bacterium]
MTTSTTTSLKLDPKIKTRLKKLAKARQRSSHWLMREAIEQYVSREEQREQFRRDALAAWAEYQATGQHVTAAEADAWLARLEAGEDAEPPPAHG